MENSILTFAVLSVICLILYGVYFFIKLIFDIFKYIDKHK